MCRETSNSYIIVNFETAQKSIKTEFLFYNGKRKEKSHVEVVRQNNNIV